MTGLSLVSVNIERSKHLDTVAPFLRRQKPDVVCVQELMQYDIPFFEKEFGACAVYVANTIHPAEGKSGPVGIGIFTSLPVLSHAVEYYWGSPEALMEYDPSSTKRKHDTETHTVVYADISKDGSTFRIATTHFTWTADGQPDDLQREDLVRMLSVLEKMGEFVLCGDFNAPRGEEIWDTIASRYKDNLPAKYTTSIDPMHRAAPLPYVVDGMFTTPGYGATDVELHEGVSDHMAVSATIAKL